MREEVRFSSGADECAAWLFRPGTAAGEQVPCVVMAHGFAGTRGARLDAYAERFAEAGLAALVFDYRHFGDSGGEPRQLLSIRRQLDDWRAAVAFARTLDGVDPERIALWGTSFSGGHVTLLAAEDDRVAAAISQSPFMDGVWALKAAGPQNLVRLTLAGLKDVAGAVRGRDPHRIPAVGAPGTTAFMTSPDAEPGYLAIVPPGAPWENSAAARVALMVGSYRPIAKAKAVACPWLIQVADADAVTPPQPAYLAAARGPRAELRHYDGAGHFDVYVGELFERVVADQVEFLTRHLLERAGAPDRATATA